jgi:hypothetical protein
MIPGKRAAAQEVQQLIIILGLQNLLGSPEK